LLKKSGFDPVGRNKHTHPPGGPAACRGKRRGKKNSEKKLTKQKFPKTNATNNIISNKRFVARH
jgi:hypothetical protein